VSTRIGCAAGDGRFDPESMTDEQKATWWERQFRTLADEETVARMKLSKMLKCPGTWKYIIPAVEKLIG